jgi:hypothetical protein
VLWLLTIAIVIAVGQVIAYSRKPRFDLVAASAALLFAMPQLRTAQPGIPSTPTILDGKRHSTLQLSFGTEPTTCISYRVLLEHSTGWTEHLRFDHSFQLAASGKLSRAALVELSV